MSDLGFSYTTSPNGEVKMLRQGTEVGVLRGKKASDFLAKVNGKSPEDVQQYLARLTGNYRRGNERNAKTHPRNR